MKENKLELYRVIHESIKQLPTESIILHVDQINKLLTGNDLFDTTYWNDFEKVLKMLNAECVERLRLQINEGVD